MLDEASVEVSGKLKFPLSANDRSKQPQKPRFLDARNGIELVLMLDFLILDHV